MTLTTSAASQLRRLFCHREDDYGEQKASGGYSRSGTALTDEALEAHVRGEQTIGLYQLRRDNTVGWICFDADGQDGDPERARPAVQQLARLCRHYALTPVVERSGGKGWHVWLFCEPTPAATALLLAQGLVGEVDETWRSGCSELAVFPKQTQLTEAQPFGNLVKLPFGKHLESRSRGEICDGESLAVLSPADQVALLEGIVPHPAAFLAELVTENGWDAPLAAAPRPAPTVPGALPLVPSTGGAGFGRPPLPCFQYIQDQGVGQGHRDNIVYSLAKLARREGQDESAALALVLGFNQAKVRPSLPDAEIRKKVRSAFTGGAAIGCPNVQGAKLCPALQGVHCPVYLRETVPADFAPPADVPAAPAYTPLTIEPLRVIDTDPPTYICCLNGVDLELSLADLVEFKRFKIRVIAVRSFLPILPRRVVEGKALPVQAVWERDFLAPALAGILERIPAPPDAGPDGVTWELVRAFLRESRVLDDLAAYDGKAIVQVEGQYFFRGQLLRDWLRKREHTVESAALWNVLRRHGGVSKPVRGNGGGLIRAWQLPAAAIEEQA